MAFVFKKKAVNIDINKVMKEIENNKDKLFDEQESIRKNMIRVINWMLDEGLPRKAILEVLSKIFIDNSKNYFNTVLYEVKKERNQEQ